MDEVVEQEVSVEQAHEPFSEAELEALRGLQYKRPALERMLLERTDLSCSFHRYLLRMQAPGATRYDAMMRAFDGDPSGVEFKAKDRDAWAFVLPDASEPGRVRIQYFDKSGFFSHHAYDSVAQCVDNLVSEGYVIEDGGALDRLSDTEAWRRGVEVAGLIQQLNAKKITHAEFNELVMAL